MFEPGTLAQPHLRHAGLSDALVLAVDDVESNLEVLEVLLVQPGVRVLPATSGRAALELLLEHEVALALVDVQMPGMSGFELAELMRGAERTRDVPIIFLTAGTPEQNRIFRGYEAGAVDFLFKPIDATLLQSKVGVFIQLYRQRQQLAAQLEEHRQLVRTAELLVGVLGHDLRTPLGAILTAGETLRLAYPDDQRALRLANTIRSTSQRMSRLIGQLLDFATARLGTLPVRPQPVDLGELAESAMTELRDHEARFLRTTCGDACGTWDPDRILQLLSNLLGNAVQHGSADGPITLHVDGEDPDVVGVTVENDGVLPEAIRNTLFSPFARAEGGSAGTGLGLYIVEQIARAHGGSVTAGTTDARTVFRVRLPRHCTIDQRARGSSDGRSGTT